jgi:hypothetical protein
MIQIAERITEPFSLMSLNPTKALVRFVYLWFIAAPLIAIGADDGEDNYLTRTEVQTKALQSRALLGDGKAALVLAGDPRLSAKEKRYWQTISAEDGFGPGILNLGVVLGQDDSDPLNVIRARYWINIAITHHVHMADYELCMLDNKTNPAPPCILPITPFRLR